LFDDQEMIRTPASAFLDPPLQTHVQQNNALYGKACPILMLFNISEKYEDTNTGSLAQAH